MRLRNSSNATLSTNAFATSASNDLSDSIRRLPSLCTGDDGIIVEEVCWHCSRICSLLACSPWLPSHTRNSFQVNSLLSRRSEEKKYYIALHQNIFGRLTAPSMI